MVSQFNILDSFHHMSGTFEQIPDVNGFKNTKFSVWKNVFDSRACTPSLWCYSGVSRMSNLLKISVDVESDFINGFSAHYTLIWKLKRNFPGSVLAKLHKNAFDAVTESSDAWWLPAEISGVEILVKILIKIG